MKPSTPFTLTILLAAVQLGCSVEPELVDEQPDESVAAASDKAQDIPEDAVPVVEFDPNASNDCANELREFESFDIAEPCTYVWNEDTLDHKCEKREDSLSYGFAYLDPSDEDTRRFIVADPNTCVIGTGLRLHQLPVENEACEISFDDALHTYACDCEVRVLGALNPTVSCEQFNKPPPPL